MAMEFDLQEELEGLQDLSAYEVPNDYDFEEDEPGPILAEAVEAVAESPDAISDPKIFNTFRSLLKHSDLLPGSLMSKLLDSISSGLAAECDSTLRDEQADQETLRAHRTPLEMYAFLISWFAQAADKVKANDEVVISAPVKRGRGRGRGGRSTAGRSAGARKEGNEQWNWAPQIPHTLAVISRVLARIRTPRVWLTTPERNTFISTLTRPAYYVMESAINMKSAEIRSSVYKVICFAVKHHGHAPEAQINIMQRLQLFEHLSEPIADCLAILLKEFDHSQLIDDVLREIAGMTFEAAESKRSKSFSIFLAHFAKQSPRTVLKQFVLLSEQLDSQNYAMRQAIVVIIGILIGELAASLATDDTPEQSTKQMIALYDLLLVRTRDANAHVRQKTIQVLAEVATLEGTKLQTHRIAVTKAAVTRLSDVRVAVRRAAIQLLIKLVETHPWAAIHGGPMKFTEWDEGYNKSVAELRKLEEQVGKVVERDGEDEEADQEGEGDEDGTGADRDKQSMPLYEDDEEEEDRESTPKRTKKSKKVKIKKENDMDVDEEQEEEEGDSEDEDEGMDDGSASNSGDDEEGTPRPRKRHPGEKKKKRPRKSELNLVALTSEQAALAALSTNEINKLRLQKRYYSEGLDFIRWINQAMELISSLLGSLNKAEVLDSMDFFRIVYQYEFEGSEVGIKNMLHLIWSKDNNATSEDGEKLKGVRARLLEVYKGLYFDPVPDLEPKEQVNRITKNMIELTYDATLAELTSLEEMMRSLMDDDQIHPDVVSRLWQVYSTDLSIPKQQRRGAIIILGMLALARRSVVQDKVDVLLQIGLGSLGKADLTLAKHSCMALQRLNGSAKKIKGSLIDNTIRLNMDSVVFRRLQDIVEMPCRYKGWFPMTEQAINTIYALGEHPDHLCATIIKNLTRKAFGRPKKQVVSDSQDPDTNMQETVTAAPNLSQMPMSQAPASQMPGSVNMAGPTGEIGDSFELAQLLFVVGHVAIKQIVHLELVEREWKRQRDAGVQGKKNPGVGDQKDQDVEELDQVAGNAEDEIGDRIHAVREGELLYGEHSLLAKYGGVLKLVCGRPDKFPNKTLRAAAILSFSKFLCVSSKFCDENSYLLFKLLEKSKDANIRSNIVIALGDVAVSFSTIIDDNSHELYKGLSDKDLVVKKNTLMVLTHLILNGMIKVKGQLGEMAKCVKDPDRRISDLAKLFFTELSTKENAIYNNLPDVISHLSTGEHAVDYDQFKDIMSYIFKFIEKDKQAENIVEKLCQRFRLSEEPRHWHDIAYCLSLLPFKSERSVKKLIEGLQFYQDKLHDQEVYKWFGEILTKARQAKAPNKPETELDEFEKILEEHKVQGEEDKALEKRGKKAAAKKRAVRTTTRAATRKHVQEEPMDED